MRKFTVIILKKATKRKHNQLTYRPEETFSEALILDKFSPYWKVQNLWLAENTSDLLDWRKRDASNQSALIKVRNKLVMYTSS